jgi:hypothetical protein
MAVATMCAFKVATTAKFAPPFMHLLLLNAVAPADFARQGAAD